MALDARGETLRRGESNIANFAADAVRAAMGADVALLNAGGFRSDHVLGPGPITRRDVLALLPFQNPLLLLSVTGAQLRAALEQITNHEPAFDGLMLDLRNTNALLFKNAGTGKHNMVYRRDDGTIGWVEPR